MEWWSAAALRGSNTPSVHYSGSSCVFNDFFDSCIAVEDAAQAIFPQRDHAQLDRLLAHHHGRRALVDQGPDGVVDGQQLEDAFAAPVTRVVAGGAAAAVVEGLVAQVVRREVEQGQLGLRGLERRAAVLADRAHQALADRPRPGWRKSGTARRPCR